MFGKKKKQQQAEEAIKRAEEAEQAAREARAEAEALREKRGLFGRKKKPAAEEKPAETPALVVAQSAPAPAVAQPAPAAAEAAAPSGAEQPAPKLSRRARKKQEKEEQRKEERIRDLELQLHRSEQRRKSARFCDFFAFTVLLLAALLMLLGPVLKLILEQTGGIEAMKTVSTVAQYCLLAAIAIPAWYFVYRKNIAWKIIYVLALVAFIVGNILGLTL